MFRTFLFVPGDRPERFDKAVASGADAVCIDLEDAVASPNKEAARRETFSYLAGSARTASVGVRFNSLECVDGFRDVISFIDSGASPAFILLPKVRSRAVVDQLHCALGGARPALWALMETPEALFSIASISESLGEGGGVVFGGADLSAALGADMSWDALYHARATTAAGAALHGRQCLDVPFLDVRNIAAMVEETRRAKAMGFTGRSCIHPDQVAPINAVFTPTADEVARAKAIIEAYEANAGRVLLHEGRLVEKPVLAAARRTLARARS
jgi:citrate lyase subunit beta/citryl-CoA lyase/(S)-citramalyl-CoA lyase